MTDALKWLCSEETNRPFTHCVCCAIPLGESGEPWIVNKEYHRGECILEYAICFPCREKIVSRVDEASKRAIREFIAREIDWEERTKELMLSGSPDCRFEACIACETPRGELEDFGISGLFDADGYLNLGPLPLLICKDCTTGMTASISEKCRKIWRDFRSQYFLGPDSDEGSPFGML